MACTLSSAPCQTDFHMMCVLFIMLNMVTGLFDNVFLERNVFFSQDFCHCNYKYQSIFSQTMYIKPAGALEKQQEFLRGIVVHPNSNCNAGILAFVAICWI